MQTILNLYRNAYGGLAPSSWMLALVMFINRSGSMVVPFLSVYLTQSLHFSLEQAGVILTIFGAGAMVGSLLGGWLSDRIGPFRVQLLSLLLGGSLLLVLATLKTFLLLAAGIFVMSVTVECLRPANTASVALYARPENVTRSFSLNRMAVNLGFSIGPALGGLLASIAYEWLFIADGITCIAAGLFFYFYFRGKRRNPSAPAAEATFEPVPTRSPYRDPRFLAFVVFTTGYAVIFFQFFTTLPLYYRQVYGLSEAMIGLLLGFNGLLVFLFEMIVIHLIGKRPAFRQLVVLGTLLCGVSYALLNVATGMAVLVLAMILVTFSEIFAMPFMITYTINRAGEKHRGAYIGLYTLAYSLAFMLAPYVGTQLVAGYGFTTLWWAAGIASVPTALGFFAVMRDTPVAERVKKEA
jgi:predicted MFS family arabinose efflux permease